MADNDATQEMDATEEQNVIADGYESSEEIVESSESREEQYLSPREEAMKQIVNEREELFDGDAVEASASEEVIEEVVEENAGPVWKDGDSWYTTIKVDGEDIQVPFDDLKSSHQKDKASQKRFEEAAEYGRRVQAREMQLSNYARQMQQQKQQQQQPLQNTSPSRDATPNIEPEEDKSELIKKYHQALYEDDADKAAELLTSITLSGYSKPVTQNVNVDKAVNEAVGRLMAQQRAEEQKRQQWAYHKSMEDAVKWFDDEYPDISKVPELRAVADNRTISLTQENPDWEPKKIIQEAADYTRQWVKGNLPENKNERVTRKKRIVQQPKAANASAKIGEDEPAPLSSSEIIQQMKEARGQVLHNN
tara:strand:+ start:4100 stop:5191 length:1092 start_codon:yes stop_codon:yes gene_type:complete